MSHPDSHISQYIQIGWACFDRAHIHETISEAADCMRAQAQLKYGAREPKPGAVLEEKG